jgi:hypothetical protein
VAPIESPNNRKSLSVKFGTQNVSPEDKLMQSAPAEIISHENFNTTQPVFETEALVQQVQHDLKLEATANNDSIGATLNTKSATTKNQPKIENIGEIQMAEVDTNMLAMQHSDIRREAAEHTNEIVKEGLKESFNIRGDVKDARYDIGERVGNQGDRIVDRVVEGNSDIADRFFAIGRDTADLRAQVIETINTVKMSTELNALKGIIEGQKNTTYLADKIGLEGDRTRALINDLKYHDLNRALVERNNELVEERNWGRHWYHGANQAQFGQQFAQLQSQMQNFNSQLSETRQGMVNFGTMAGVGQTSSANNVR